MTLHVLGINGSLRGAQGSSAQMLDRALANATALGHGTHRIDLATYGCDASHTIEAMVDAITRADAVIVATGTYWGAPSSLVQRWLEVLTFTEGTSVWRGTAVGVITTMHSVGGLEAAQRLAGTLILLGATVPAAGIIALGEPRGAADADTWVPDDIDTLAHNVLAIGALRPTLRTTLRHWPVEPFATLHGRWPGEFANP